MRLFGHPVHPMLVHFPVAFLLLATVCDALALLGVDRAWPIAWMALALGLLTAVPAMIAGLVDLAALPQPAERDGKRHMIAMSSAWTAYLVAFLLHMDGSLPPAAGTAFSLAGAALLSVGAWYGGQLVYTHGAGRRAGPHG